MSIPLCICIYICIYIYIHRGINVYSVQCILYIYTEVSMCTVYSVQCIYYIHIYIYTCSSICIIPIWPIYIYINLSPVCPRYKRLHATSCTNLLPSLMAINHNQLDNFGCIWRCSCCCCCCCCWISNICKDNLWSSCLILFDPC